MSGLDRILLEKKEGKNFTIYLGDSFYLVEKMADESVNMIITDPPYSAVVPTKKEKFWKWFEPLYRNMLRITTSPHRCIISRPKNQAKYFRNQMDNRGKLLELEGAFWDKRNDDCYWVTNFSTDGVVIPGAVRKIDIPQPTHKHTRDPYQIAGLLDKYTGVNDMIFDPFMGGAGIGCACLITGRKYVGCEMKRHFFEQCYERLSKVERLLK